VTINAAIYDDNTTTVDGTARVIRCIPVPISPTVQEERNHPPGPAKKDDCLNNTIPTERKTKDLDPDVADTQARVVAINLGGADHHMSQEDSIVAPENSSSTSSKLKFDINQEIHWFSSHRGRKENGNVNRTAKSSDVDSTNEDALPVTTTGRRFQFTLIQ
jgi:hypothetical protein